MLPPFPMSVSHLGLKKSPKTSTFNGPPYSVALFDPTLNDEFVLRQTVDIDPNTLIEDLLGFESCMLVLKSFSSPWLTPEALTAPMSMLA